MTRSEPGRQGILLIQSLGLGDLLFAVPLIKVLKRNFPDDPITVVTHQRNTDLLTLVPEVDRSLPYERKSPGALARLIQETHRGCRLAFVLNPILRGSLLAWCAGAPTRVGYRRDYERK